MKKLAFFALLFIMAMPVYADDVNLTLNYNGESHEYTAPPVNLIINGTPADNLDMPPIIIDDYTLVPVRACMEYMGAVVEWRADTQDVFISSKADKLLLRINETLAIVNDDTVTMPLPAMLINDRTMIPLRFVADNLSFSVNWDESARTVYIDGTVDAIEPPPAANVNNTENGADVIGGAHAHETESEDTESDFSINRNPSMYDTIIPAIDVSETEILPMYQYQTKITSIKAPESGNNLFTITAASAISKVEKKQLEDNRMYVDIYSAELDVDETSYTFADNPDVVLVKAAQNAIEPEKIVRIVFYLRSGAEYYIELTPDRKALTVGFKRTVIEDISFDNIDGRDIITITGSNTPNAKVYRAGNSTGLIVSIPYAETDISALAVAGSFTRGIQSVKDGDNVIITLDLTERVSYNLSYSGAAAVVTLYRPTYKNIEYDYDSGMIVITKIPGVYFDISSFIHKDDYSLFKYTITIPADYSDYFGEGNNIIGGLYINSYDVSTDNGQTSIVIDETRVLAYNVYEDTANIYIEPVLPKEKYERIVVIDPGHGAEKPGTRGHGIIEKNLNLDIALRLVQMFENSGAVKVYSTRLTDINPSFPDRVLFAAENAHLFVSIHNNYAGEIENTPNREASGVEVLYRDYSFDKTSGMPAIKAAEIMQKRIVSTLGCVDRGIIYRDDLYVLNYAKVPAILVEVGFLSHPGEAAKLATNEYKTLAALGLYAGIIDIFDEFAPSH